jgi:hypothetical protein
MGVASRGIGMVVGRGSGERFDTGTVRSWCLKETAHWSARRLDFAAAVEQFRAWNDTRDDLFLFEIAGRRVSVAPKSAALQSTPFAKILHVRADHYRRHVQAVLDAHALTLSTMFVVAVADRAGVRGEAPVFGFQKTAGEPILLLPDIDFLTHDFYDAPLYRDEVAFDDKTASAVFTGSTTGGEITMDIVRRLALPRLRAARRFSGSADVAFDLPNIVQCDSPETAAALAALGLPSRRRTWPEQFRHKFLLSMDGNGATCSRVAIALRSNSVLLKYESPHSLYYFSEMIPWKHYIPIGADDEVENIIALERRSPGLFQFIADEGKNFYYRYLRRRDILFYTASLLFAYAQSFA